mgnify:FL=1
MWNNRVILSGNLVKDVEVKVTEGESSKHVANFSVAVQRPQSKDAVADFINCVAWGQPADYLGSYGKKGSHITIEGELRTRNYERDGQKVYVTEIYVSSCHVHVEKKKDIEESMEEA